MLWICNSIEHLPYISLHKKTSGFSAATPVVKTNIYSAAGGDVCRLQFAQLVGGERSSGRCGTAATTRNPCLLGHAAVTLVTLGHFRHLDQPFVQAIDHSPHLDQTFSHWVWVSHQAGQPINLFNLIAVSIACTSEKSLFSPWSSFHLLQHPHQLKLK